MNIKTTAVLLLCLSMGCSTTRSAAGGFSLASGIATGIGAIALTGVAASNGSSGGSVLPMVAGISMSALLSTTFLTLAGYLLGSEGICAQELEARAAADQAARVARIEEARVARNRDADLCRETPNGLVIPWFSGIPVRCVNGVAHH
jgi:hypothetical protein